MRDVKYRNDKRAIFVIYRLDKGGRECRFQGIKILLPDLKNISDCRGGNVKKVCRDHREVYRRCLVCTVKRTIKETVLNFAKDTALILSGKEYRVNCKPKKRMKDEYFRMQGAQ